MQALSEVFPRRVFLKSLALSLANHAVFVAVGWLVANALGIAISHGVAAGVSACMLGVALVWSLAGGLAFYWPVRPE
jgi:hypothetical protein